MKMYLEDGRKLKFKRKDAEKVALFLDIVCYCLKTLNAAADAPSVCLMTDDLEFKAPDFLTVISNDGEPLQWFNVGRDLEDELDQILHDEFVQREIYWQSPFIDRGIEA